MSIGLLSGTNTMNEIVNYVIKHFNDLLAIMAMFGIVVEITPVKINPISYVLKKAGNIINADINAKVDRLENYVTENHKQELRIQISNFASDLRHNEPKSESQFIAIIQLCDEYLANKWNSKVKLDAEFIKGEYLKIGQKIKNEEIKL